MKKSVSMKTVVLLLVAVLLLGGTIGGTLAYLTAKTGEVKNTFVLGDIDLRLTETWNYDSDGDNENDAWQAKLIPGTTVAKDPKVTVVKNSEACWVFVKIVETTPSGMAEGKSFSDYIQYTPADGWTALAGQTGVYYREVSSSTDDQTFAVLTDNQVSIPDSVKKSDTDDLTGNFELTFTAYAIQREGVETAVDAWAKLNG